MEGRADFPSSLPTPPAGLAPIYRDQGKTDSNYLRALAIFHYLLAAFNMAIIAYLVYGMVMMARMTSEMDADMAGHGQPSAMHPWWNFGGVMVVFGGIYGAIMVLNAASGWCIAHRKAWTFSVVIAGLDLIYFPLGTVLGVFTLIVLLRGSVGTLYAEAKGRVGP